MNTLENVKKWFVDRDLENGGRLDKQSLKLSEEFGELCAGYLKKNEKNNKAIIYSHETEGAKKAILSYNIIKTLDNYMLLEVDLQTGRHHQIRAQLSKIGIPIKGDLKYGAPRSNPDGGISLHARMLEFIHPVSKELIKITAPVPQNDAIWKACEM